MNTNDQAFNRSPCHTDWQRFDIPTVLRRQGRGFLERTWKPEQLNQEQHALSKPELETLVASYGGLCLSSADNLLLIFDDYHWARRCQNLLDKRGVLATRFGCYLQLPGSG
jgi:hypothetical protein